MFTENEENLIYAIADADLGEDFAYIAVSVLEDEEMEIITEYIRGELKKKKKVLRHKVSEAIMILKGEVEVEED